MTNYTITVIWAGVSLDAELRLALKNNILLAQYSTKILS